MCGCCMGSIIFILGVLESVAWFLCYQICLDSSTFGGNYYLGLVTGLLAIVVGILAITYLCLLHSYLVIVSLLVDVPLLFSSSICLIISAVNSSVERSDGGDGVLLIAQSVLSTFIALLSVIFAVQYCCIQNTSFNEEESAESENQIGVRRGPQRYNPYVDDDARSLPNGRFSEIPAVITQSYHVSQPTTTTSPTGSNSNNPRYDRRNGGIHNNVNQPQPTDRVGRTASMYLGRRPSRGVNNRSHVFPNGRTPRQADDDSLQSFNLGPILGNFDLRNSPDDLANGSSGHVNAGADDDNLPDFDSRFKS
ncbi:hypothetical protein BSL78_08290 [Apostichopus japonicus]|uniref:Uncharacterized protein n=1 Tax=Stichopus japonicus TaxID=307972 RepID=A0A2G8L3F1_STIJA|nr:hypothetical protein BSL78_08290 [Apostichopus japonicus]